MTTPTSGVQRLGFYFGYGGQNPQPVEDGRYVLHTDYQKLEEALMKVKSILNKADLCKVSDKLSWANAISEARVELDKK